jgi:hypothetical protein
MKHFNDAHVEFTLKEKKMDEENWNVSQINFMI